MISYPLVELSFFSCLRIIISKNSWITLRLKVYAVLDSKLGTVSKYIYVL